LRKILYLFQSFLIFVIVLALSFSFVLTNPTSAKALIAFAANFYGYSIDISIKNLDWNPVKPILSFSNLSLKSKEYNNKTIISLEDVKAEINLFKLIPFQPIAKLSISSGSLSSNGILPSSIPLQIPAISSSFINLLLSFETLDINDLKIKNHLTHNTILIVKRVSTNPYQKKDNSLFLHLEDTDRGEIVFTLKPSEITSDKDYLKGYLRVQEFDIPKFLLNSCDLCKDLGKVDSEVWISIMQDKLISLEGRIDIFSSNVNDYFGGVKADVSLIEHKNFPSFLLSNILITKDLKDYSFPNTLINFNTVAYNFNISSIGFDHPLLSKGLEEFIPDLDKSFSFKGNIKNMSFSFNGIDPPEVSGKLEKFNLLHTSSKTSLNNLGGNFLFYRDKFLFSVDSSFIKLESKKLYENPLEIYDLQANIFGSKQNTQLAFTNQVFLATINSLPLIGQFSFFPENDLDSAEFDLYVSVKDANHKEFKSLIPRLKSTEQIISWTDSYINCGVVEQADIFYRGFLGRSLNKGTQTFQMAFDLEDACFRFFPLELSAISLIGQIEDNTFFGKIRDSSFLGSDLISDIKVSKLNKDSPSLQIFLSGHFSGPFNSLVQLFLNNTSKGLKESSKNMKVSGNQTTHFSTNFPLGGEEFSLLSERSFLSLKSKISDASLLGYNKLSFTDIFASIDFDTKTGLKKSNLSARLNSIPLRFDLYTTKKEKNSFPLTYISSQISLSDKDITKIYPFFSGRLKGQAKFSINLKLPGFIRGYELIDPQLTLESSLKDLEITLPSPFGKGLSKPSSLKLISKYVSKEDRLEVNLNYKNFLRGKFLYGDKSSEGFVILGEGSYPLELVQNKFFVSGSLKKLDLSQYISFSSEYTLPLDKELFFIKNLKVKEMQLGSMVLKETLIDMERADKSFKFFLISEALKGIVLFPDSKKQEISVDLDYLKLNDLDQSPEIFFRSVMQNMKVPVLFSVHSLEVDKELFGSWKFNLSSTQRQMTFKDIEGNYGRWRVGKIGDKTNSRLTLNKNSKGWTTNLNTSLFSDSPNKAFDDLSLEVNFSSERVEFFPEISWKGFPQDFSIESFTGSLGFNFNELLFEDIGEEQEATSGVLKIISIFNVTDTFEKLTNLNFDKFYKSGFSLDNAKGVLSINRNKVLIRDPIMFYSGSSKYRWTGYAKKSKKGEFTDLDLEVIMTLPLKDYLPAYAFLLGGPLTAGVVYIAGKAFEKRLDKLSSGKWRIWGNIENPKTEFKGWFED